MFTTHVSHCWLPARPPADHRMQFLDEADLLADYIAILAAPGKVVASGPPVALKRDLGEGYTMQVALPARADTEKIDSEVPGELLQQIRSIAPQTYTTTSSPSQFAYHLRTRDSEAIRRVLSILDAETRAGKIVSYSILGTTIEDIFLELMRKHGLPNQEHDEQEKPPESPSPLPKTSAMELPTGRQCHLSDKP